MLVEILPDYDAISERAARLVSEEIRRRPAAVLGCATGSTPIGLYQRLISRHAEEGLDFSGVTTFNLDEYVGLPPEHPQSYWRFMREHFFDQVGIAADRIHIPDGMAADLDAACAAYERSIEEAGGIDLQILGIGSNAHLAFNEPGSSLGSRTRVQILTEKTLADNARFFGEGEAPPREAVTMGLGTIMEARKLLMLASGTGKAAAVRDALEGPVTAMCPASVLQMHPHAHILLDEAAASALAYRHRDGIAEPKQ
jgi:glucosamine-6-phosphate deaminase